MDYYLLTDMTAQIGYELAAAGAETFRIEETMRRVLAAYGIECETFAIPNCVMVSLEADNGKPLMVMKRVGFHGNDLDAVGRFGADAARERVELFHRLEVIAVKADALHHHQRLAVGRLEADHHAVGDGKGLAFNAVGTDDAAYRLFDAERLRPAERQMIADARGQIGQKVIIHKKSSYFWEICRQRALYYSETTVLSMLTGRSRKKHLPFCRGGTILVLG